MAVLLGLAVAACYGTGDFLGGLASKRAPTVLVVLLSQLFGLVLLVGPLALDGAGASVRALSLGAAAGLAGAVGLLCLYAGLSLGRMTVVAPITAVGAAIIPVFWGLTRGERPTAVALIGVAVALVAVVLVSASPDPAATDGGRALSVITLAVVAGLGFGVVFVLLSETRAADGLWPLIGARAASVTAVGGAALWTGRLRPPPARSVLPTIALCGLFDMAANAIYLVAVRRGLLALVAVLASLYPAATVVLARIVLRERLGRLQLAGLALAGGGVVLIASG